MTRFLLTATLLAALVSLTAASVASAQGPECFGAPATITGSGTIVGTSGDDVIVGSAGRDVIVAQAGDDVVCGGQGDDIILGRLGDDTLAGDDGLAGRTLPAATT